MPKDSRPQPLFIGEHKGLDFINTFIQPNSGPIEWLADGEDLLDWCIAAGLATAEELAPLRADPTAVDQAAAEVRQFRQTFRDFVEEVAGSPDRVADHDMIYLLNQNLAPIPQQLQLADRVAPVANRTAYQLSYQIQIRNAQDLLSRLAALCANLICEADFRYVKNCEGPDCALYFLDVSKSHKRRWCSMDLCGNRAKAASFRMKQ